MDEQNQQQGAQQQQQQSQPQPAQAGGDAKDVQDNKVITFLSYIGILCLVPLLAKKDSKFAQFHAKQGLVLVIVEVAGMILTPVFGLGILVHLVAFILSIIGLINVAGGKMAKLPIVGDLAEKFKI